MATPEADDNAPIVPQPVAQPLTRAAIFLVVTMNAGAASRSAVRSFCGELPALLRAVGFRNIEENLSSRSSHPDAVRMSMVVEM